MGRIIAFALIFPLVFLFLFSIGTVSTAFGTFNNLRHELYTDFRNVAIKDVSLENLGYRDILTNKEKRDLVLSGISSLDVDNENIKIDKLEVYSDNDVPVNIEGTIYSEAGIWVEYTLTVPAYPFSSAVDISTKEYIEADTFLARYQK